MSLLVFCVQMPKKTNEKQAQAETESEQILQINKRTNKVYKSV